MAKLYNSLIKLAIDCVPIARHMTFTLFADRRKAYHPANDVRLGLAGRLAFSALFFTGPRRARLVGA